MEDNEKLIQKLESYCAFLAKLDLKIDGFFQSQKPYIFCKSGCAKCCKSGQYPCSELEFELIKIGFQNLPDEIKAIIKNNVEKIKQDKVNCTSKTFLYECPFLVDNKCSVYVFRPLVCRTFGLAQFKKDKSLHIPFCVDEGLNYHQVYDFEREMFSNELFEKTGYKEEPIAFNLSLDFIINEYGKNQNGLDFGNIKTIIDFF